MPAGFHQAPFPATFEGRCPSEIVRAKPPGFALLENVKPKRFAYSGRAFSIQRRDSLVQNGLECRLVGHGQISQRFTINLNFGCGQPFHKTAVSRAKLPASSIDSLNPEDSESCVSGSYGHGKPSISPSSWRLWRSEKAWIDAPDNPLALSRTLLRRSLLAGAFVALGIFIIRHLPDPHAQVVVSFTFPFSDLTCRISPERLSGKVENVCRFSVERQVFFYPRYIGWIEDRGLSEMTLALGTFGYQQVPTARLATQHFAGRRYLEALRHCFFSFASRYWFWHREPGTYTLGSSSQQEIGPEQAKHSTPSIRSELRLAAARCREGAERFAYSRLKYKPAPV